MPIYDFFYKKKARTSFTVDQKNLARHRRVQGFPHCRKGRKYMLDRIALVISIIGSLNWGLIGLFQFDLVAWICGGPAAILSRIIYTIVAICGLWCIGILFRTPARVRE